MALSEQLQRAALVVNTGSRSGADAADRAEERLRELGYGVDMHRVEGGDDLAGTIQRAVDAGPDLLVVGGGDGSVSCAADHLSGTDVVLGVLPLGTANDFARTLQVPEDLEGALDVLDDGRIADIDLGRVDGRAFLNVASIGLSVAVTEKLSSGMKKGLGPAAYTVATLRAYRSHERFSARLEFPNGDHETKELEDLLQVAVGNGRLYGGGNAVAPHASIDDHLLDVYAIEGGGLRENAAIALSLKDGSFVEHETGHHLTTRRVRIVTDTPQDIDLDGEVAARTPAEFVLERNAVRVVLPADSDAADLE